MSCTCTEDKFLYDQTTKTETPWDGKATGIIIGRNRVMCQECIDNNAKAEVERKKQEVVAQLNQLDMKLIRPLSEGDIKRIQEILSQKDELRKSL